MSGKPTRFVFGYEIHGFALREHEVIMAFDHRNERELFEAWWQKEGRAAFLESFVVDGQQVECPICGRLDLPSYQCWRVGHLVKVPKPEDS